MNRIPDDPEIRSIAAVIVIGFWGLFGYVMFVAPQLRKWRVARRRKKHRKISE